MAHSDTLRQRVQKMESALTDLRKEWHTQMVAESPLQVGDLVKITTPQAEYDWNRGLAATSTPLPDKIKYGRVRELKIEWDKLKVCIAPQTRKGFHACTEIYISYEDKVEKVDSIPTQDGAE